MVILKSNSNPNTTPKPKKIYIYISLTRRANLSKPRKPSRKREKNAQ